MDHATIYIILAALFGFFMAWGVGANDVANAMGTSVGSKALTLKQAIIIAIIFEAAGALLAGGEVTDTIRSKIIDVTPLTDTPEIYVFGMLSSLLAAGVWLLLASLKGWPVSTTHSIIGAIIGFGSITVGVKAIYWSQVVGIVASWVVTPIIAGIIAFLLFTSIQKYILNTDDPLLNAKRIVPIYVFIVSFVLSMVTVSEGLKHVGLSFNFHTSLIYALGAAVVLTILGKFLLHRADLKEAAKPKFDFVGVERVFGLLMIFTACAMAFAHGSNDVANAIGPLAAIVNIVDNAGKLTAQSPIPFWVLGLGATGIVAGLSMYGYKMIAIIGQHITELTPTRGFSAELATATTVVLASGTGLPISTTQTLVGAILGVGFARGIGALNLNVIRNIFMSWVITLPAGAVLSVSFFYTLRFIFG